MKKIQCEVCGSTDIKKIKDSIFECQSCGVQYSVDDVKKLFVEIDGTVEINGTVKIDKTDRISNLYQLAEADIDKNDCGNAQKYYESIIVEEPTSWKAHFFIPYIKAWNSKRGEICKVANDFYNNYSMVIKLISEHVNENEQLHAIKIVFERSKKLFDMLNRAIIAMYNDELAWQPFVPSSPGLSDIYQAKCEKKNHDIAAQKEMAYKKEVICKIMSTMGDVINSTFQTNAELNYFAIESWKDYVSQLSTISNFSQTAKQGVISYSEKIKQYDDDYSFVSLIPGVTKEKMVEIEQALNNNNPIEAIKICRECSGMGLSEAQLAIGKLMDEKGISIQKKKASAESKMSFCAGMALTPWTFIAGIFVLCFMNKAKEENGGTLSQKAKKYLIMGIAGFCVWILFFIILFASIA